jgi:hypothetical protein
MLKKLIIFLAILGILGIIVLMAFVGYYLYLNYYLPKTATLPPPLANVDFPTEQVQYPADWPDELKFPEDLVLTDSSSGTLPDSAAMGWSAKLRFQGKPLEAEKIISAYFKDKGWTIVESTELDSGGFSLIIQREQGNGIIVIDTDPNNSSQTIIIATVFP